MKKVVVHRFQEHFKNNRKIVEVISNFDNNPELVQVRFEGGISLLMGTAEFNKIKKQIPEELWKKPTQAQPTSQSTPTEAQPSQPTKKGVGAGRVSVRIRNTNKDTKTESEQKS